MALSDDIRRATEQLQKTVGSNDRLKDQVIVCTKEQAPGIEAKPVPKGFRRIVVTVDPSIAPDR